MTDFNIILAVVVALLTALSYFKGRRLLFLIIVSFYPAAFLYSTFPYTSNFLFFKQDADQIFYSHVLIFAVFFLLSFFVLRRIMHGDGGRQGVAGFIDALLLSVSVVLLTVALTYHVLPFRDIYHLSVQIQNFFTQDLGYFISVMVPLAVVYWVTGRY